MEPWRFLDSAEIDWWNISNCSLIFPNIFVDEEPVEDENHLRDDLEWLVMCQITTRSILTYYQNYVHKIPCRTSIRTGHRCLEEILNGHEVRCYQAFRLSRSVFMDFCHELAHKYGLRPTRGMSLYEEVGVFLVTCAHGVDNRLLQELFNHSGETISRHFHRVLKVVGKLADTIITPHPEYNEGKGYHKPQHERYMPFFKVSDFVLYSIYVLTF
ncbi:PREDICTED: uncharacterized protein LOC105966388 [Erythranthe guttata]|uniref:uncharacterized protein LOC105966388 n=1 Tax=Erythranthe guttata TaxID=4155 RepID=UPI00064DA321|nr:PREDICTED: uncharacterized protein LOC105966388 [Erythranthe guttata]|eukprot:XP_012846400.1 PREDICTED: uncharacterized protein LOC105966388 [Erythranthe guttata]